MTAEDVACDTCAAAWTPGDVDWFTLPAGSPTKHRGATIDPMTFCPLCAAALEKSTQYPELARFLEPLRVPSATP